jgi:hypothetical protein
MKSTIVSLLLLSVFVLSCGKKEKNPNPAPAVGDSTSVRATAATDPNRAYYTYIDFDNIHMPAKFRFTYDKALGGSATITYPIDNKKTKYFDDVIKITKVELLDAGDLPVAYHDLAPQTTWNQYAMTLVAPSIDTYYIAYNYDTHIIVVMDEDFRMLLNEKK